MNCSPRPLPRAAATAAVVVVCAALAFALGFAVWALLHLVHVLTGLIWRPFEEGEVPHIAALPVLTAGGALLGWLVDRFKSAPESFAEVIAAMRERGSYSVGRPLPALAAFLLPLALGAPVGPEAGLTGFAAAGVTGIARVRARVRAKLGLAGEPGAVETRLTRALGIACGLAGAGVGMLALGRSGLPRYAAPAAPLPEGLIWVIPLTLAGMLLAAFFRVALGLGGRISRRLHGRAPLRAAVCGALVALVALGLPYVLFSGTEHLGAVIADPAVVGGPATLAATALAKIALLALCLTMGWHGGPFFPLITAASFAGLALAGVAGIDAALAMTVIVAALLGRYTRKVGVTLVVLLLCVPPAGIAWAVAPALAGALLPTIGRPGEGAAD